MIARGSKLRDTEAPAPKNAPAAKSDAAVKDDPAPKNEPVAKADQRLSQRRRQEAGRYLLQVDRQTKSSYETLETAEAAGLAIKTGHPIVQVSVYDTVDCVNKSVELPAA